ncbi:Cna protein B-type domain protein [Planctomycetes bacterium Poly30]|uniref:Cna protein B-type domain protein n=1 Tax=Saltatorellus ferox TaxID=2528018 RepID=A0A518EQ59_9BACT|nr:Cna protein B-type domain protein [Planctomycetes bacterium Poly30]
MRKASGKLAGALALALAVLAGLLYFRFEDGGASVGGESLSFEGPEVDHDPGLETGRSALAEIAEVGPLRSDGETRDASVRLRGPGRLRGRVLERGSERGLEGVTVELLPVPPAGAEIMAQVSQFIGSGSDFSQRVRPAATTVTAFGGEFSFEGVREGRWYLGATAPHHVADAPVSARVLRSGDGGPVDVWMRSGGRVIGQVLDGRGRPVAKAQIALTTSSMGLLEAAADGVTAFLRAEADRDGRFAFAGVSPAEGYELAAIGEGMAITHVLDLEVRAGEDTVVEVRGTIGAQVRGRIVSASSSPGSGAEPGTAPVAGAQVAALPRGLRNLKLAKELLMATHTVTGEDGCYLLTGVPPGAVDLLAMADDHVPARGPLVQVPNSPGAEVQARDFALLRGPKVRGRAVDVSGAPVPGARILWNVIDVASVEGQPSLAPLFAAGMKEFEFPVSDHEGAFVAGPLGGDSPFEIRALKSGYEVGRARWEPGDEEATVEVVLHRGGAILGSVSDALTEAPVASFTVSVSGRIEADPAAPSRFNPFAGGVEFEGEDGRFELAGIAGGEQELTVLARGYLPKRAVVHVPEGGAAPELELKLEPGATLRGLVVDAEGEPIAGAQVTTEALIATAFERLEDGRGSIESALAVKGRRRQRRAPPVGLLRHLVALGFLGEGAVSTARDGSFELVGLDAGPAEILAFHRDYRAGAVLTSVERGDGNSPVTITLTEGGGLRGKVTDRFGQPVRDAMVLAVSPGMAGGPTSNGELHQARSRVDGAYEMLHMEGGPYLIVATRGDENLSIMSFLGTLNFGLVHVPEERVVTHHLVDTSASACRVTGLVTRGGAPVSSGMLLALNLESEGLLGLDFKAAPVENDGSYVFEGLSPGEYQVTFEGDGPSGEFLIDVPDAPQLVEDLELPEGVVRGRFVSAESGEAVQGLRLRLERTGRSGSGGLLTGLTRRLSQGMTGGRGSGGRWRDGSKATGRQGGFRFDGLDEGRYRLVLVGDARSADFAPPEDVEIRVGEDETVDLGTIVLDPGRSLRGLVLDGAGDGVEGAEVLAIPVGADGLAPRRALADAEGAFEVRGLGVGTWKVRPSAEGFAAGSLREVVVEEGRDSEELRLTLVLGLEIEVRVVDGSGTPRAGVACFLSRAEDEATTAAASGSSTFLSQFFSGSNTTDSEGLMPLGRFEPGVYRLRASQGFSSTERQVELEGTGTRRLEIVLR